MKKTDFLTNVKEKMAAQDVAISKKDLEVVMTAMEEVIYEAVKAGDDVKFAGAKFAKKDVPAKSGTTVLGGEPKAWTKPAHSEGAVKATKTLKDLFA